MEGNFLTKPQRQKFVNEIKKTHFKLGNYKPEPQQEKEVKLERGVSASVLAKMMRSTHFGLGSDKAVSTSEATSRYKPFEVSKSPYVVPDVSIDLRKTHYSLGSFRETPISTSRSVQVLQNPQGDRALTTMTAEFSTSHHFKYGTDQPSHASSHKLDFNKKKLPEGVQEEVTKIKQELRKTHFEVGSSNANYETGYKTEYNAKQINLQKASMDLQKEHFKLGTDKASYQTNYKSSQEGFAKGKQEFKAEVLRDLRQSHFVLGSSQSEYIKTSQDFNGGKPADVEKLQDGRLRKTNFILGNNEKPWKTSYKDSHSNSTASLAVSSRDRNTDKASHFVLGNSDADYLSVHAKDFKESKVFGQRDQKWAEYLRKHHFDMGQFKPSFASQNQKYGKGKVEAVGNDKEMAGDLRASHFKLGNDKNEMVSTAKSSFSQVKASKSVEKLEKVHGKHSYRDGNGKFYGNTEQKSRFNWIKPVADNNFKFSFE